MAEEPFVSLRRTSALREQSDALCAQAGFRPRVVFEGDDLSTVRGFVAAGLGGAIVPAPRAGSPEAAAGPLAHCRITDPGAVRDLRLTWSAERRLRPSCSAGTSSAGQRGPGPGPVAVTPCRGATQPGPGSGTA